MYGDTTVTSIVGPGEDPSNSSKTPMDNSSVKVYNLSNGIIVENALNQNIVIYDYTGKLITHQKIIDNHQRIDLPQKNVYIIKVGNNTTKICVK